MIVMIVVGWTVVLPLCVVLGLFCASKVLGHRSRVRAARASDMSASARSHPTLGERGSPAPATEAGQPTRSVSAGY
jgi:hypothetical protein